jgi:hypothetical protein
MVAVSLLVYGLASLRFGAEIVIDISASLLHGGEYDHKIAIATIIQQRQR